jgi:hypothetical protein
MTIVKLLNKSRNSSTGAVIRTFLIEEFPKLYLAEVNTHRVFSRNWESSRARPVSSVIEQVQYNPFIPMFTRNQGGMKGEALVGEDELVATELYLEARDQALAIAKKMADLKVHKQDVNRLLEPWMLVSGIITTTELDNFLALRDHPDAAPAMRDLAIKIREADDSCAAAEISPGDWHMPWPDLSREANVAKAMSVSYANHAKDRTEEDYQRMYQDACNATPIHASVLEHCAMALAPGIPSGGNFRGFRQLRWYVEKSRKEDRE